eukprot:804364_1
MAAQRALYDRPQQWMWYFTHYNGIESMEGIDGEELGIWMNHLVKCSTMKAFRKFSTQRDCDRLDAHRSRLMENSKKFEQWKEEMMQTCTTERSPNMHNPLLDCMRTMLPLSKVEHPIYFVRRALSTVYSTGIPGDRVIQELAEYAPKILQAGNRVTGYWGYLLSQAGADVKLVSRGRPIFGDMSEWGSFDRHIDINDGDFLKEQAGKCDDRLCSTSGHMQVIWDTIIYGTIERWTTHQWRKITYFLSWTTGMGTL